MNITLTREQVRQVDRLAIEQLGIPGIVLMENAARGATDAVLAYLNTRRQIAFASASAVILCGGGNNGGDGYAMARHLHNRGVKVALYALKAPADLQGDAATNCTICQHMGLPIHLLGDDEVAISKAAAVWAKADLLVDAILGTGFQGEVREPAASIIARVNRLAQPVVVAVDVPSGLDCQTGTPSSATIQADLTVTFVASKTGFDQPAAKAVLGEVVVADIGVPPELIARITGQSLTSG